MKKVVSCLLSVVLLLALVVAAPKPVQAAASSNSIENGMNLRMATERSLSHVTLAWDYRSDAVGYQVYMKANTLAGDRKYHKIATVKGLTYVTPSLATDTYSFKVRAYAKKNGKTVYSSFSNVKTVDVSLLSYGLFGVGLLQDEKELSDLTTMVGGMKKVSSKSYPDFAAKGNGVSIGLNRSVSYPKPYLFIRVKGNPGFYFGGICCGYSRETALSVSGDEFESYDGGKTFVIGDGSGVNYGTKMVPTYDKNDIITEMVLTIGYSG